jgi:hypothetical protein
MAKPREPAGVDVRTLRTAKTLIERHGDGALAFAEAQAERLGKGGSKSSAEEWNAAAIRHLSAGPRQR